MAHLINTCQAKTKKSCRATKTASQENSWKLHLNHHQVRPVTAPPDHPWHHIPPYITLPPLSNPAFFHFPWCQVSAGGLGKVLDQMLREHPQVPQLWGVDVEGVEGPGTQGGNKGVSQISGFRDATNIAGWKNGRPPECESKMNFILNMRIF